MSRVLILSYDFPPTGGGGVQRVMKFVKYLPDFGWQPVVLTAGAGQTSIRDPSLNKEIPACTAVIRTSALTIPPWLPWRVRSLIRHWLLIVDEQIGWLPFAVRRAGRIFKKEAIDVIYSTSAPYTAHCVGYLLKKRTGLPWVADFRDPWVGNFVLRFPTSWHRKNALALERRIVHSADRVVVVSEPMRQFFLDRYPEIAPQKVITIPNGYDPDDFAGLSSRAKPESKRFTVVYNGTFYSRFITPYHFLKALRLAVDNGRIPADEIQVQFVGNTGKLAHKLIKAFCLEGIVLEFGHLSHRKSIRNLMNADSLLLIIGSSPDSQGILTGKLYEYLASQKPILGLVPPGGAADLIREANAGVIAAPEHVEAIEWNLVEMYRRWKDGNLEFASKPDIISRYNRRTLTALLAEALNQTLSGPRI